MLLAVLEALPLVALPPVVLPLTLALPVDALCEFELVTLRQLVLLTTTLLEVRELIVLLESGPVLLMLPPLPPLLLLLIQLPLAELLLIEAEVLKSLLLLASPEPALPPVVLWLTLAEPLLAPWPLLLLAWTSFLLLIYWLLLVRFRTLLCELGPVPEMSAAAKPVVRPKPKTVVAATRISCCFISYLPWVDNDYFIVPG